MTAIQVRKTAEEPGAASLAVTVPVEEVREAEARATSAYQRRARLPGFRKGKAPAALVKKQFGDDIRQQALEELIRESWKAALAQETLHPVADPHVHNLKWDVVAGGPGTLEVPGEGKPGNALERPREFPLKRTLPQGTAEQGRGPRTTRRVRARSRGLRVARGAAPGGARRSREGSRARSRCRRAARPDRADRAGESCGGAAAAGRAGGVRVRPSVRDPGRPAARIRAGVPARGRGAGAARPDPRLGGGAPRPARHRGGARRAAAGNRRAQRQVRRRAAGVAREGEAAARPGARSHRGKGVYVSSVAIHRGASVTRNQIYPPYIIERSSRGERTYDIFSRLLLDRIVFLGTQINDDVSNIIIAQLLFLDADNPERDIYLYINSH